MAQSLWSDLQRNLWAFSICTSAAHTVISYFRCSLVLAAAVAVFRCSSLVCNNVTRLLLDRCASLSLWLTHTCIQMCMERVSFPSSLLNILPHLVGGTGTFLCCAGVGPAWLMGLSERGRDPCYEPLPVSVEAVFRGLRWSQETVSASRSTSSLRWCCHSK